MTVPAIAQQAEDIALDQLIDTSATTEGALTLARSQAGSGNLLDAAATLERALLNRPGTESDLLRLLYATVLCQLDDRRRAAYQIANARLVTATDMAEVRQACGNIVLPQPTRGDGFAGELAFGLAYDGDAYGALATQLELPTLPSLSDNGLSITTSARIDGRFDSRDDHHFYGGVSFQSKDSVDGPRLDYRVGGARLGFATRLGNGGSDLWVGGVVRHARLFDRPFVTEYGGQAVIGIATGAVDRVAIAIEAVDQRYHGTAIDRARSGTRYDLAASYQAQPASGHSYVAGVAVELKDADIRTLAYRGGRAFAAASVPIADNGTYLGVSGTARYVDYRSVGATNLTEWRLYARAAVGLPLGPEGLFAEAATSYTARHYNAASLLRDYNSFSAELRLVFRFGK